MAVDSDGSDFSDDMALMPSMKAHTGGQGFGAASAPAAAVPLKKVAVHRPHAADVLLAERMRIVQQYDLTTAAGMDKFAQEIILQRTPARMDVDLGAMNVQDAREVRKADIKHFRRFLECPPSGSWRRTEQVQPFLWEHGVRLCAPRCCRFEIARGPGASLKSISQARGACTCCGQRHVQDEVAW